jgi:RteC protein
MKENFLQLYKDLAVDLTAILNSGSDREQKMEECFKCCKDYWGRLKEKIKADGFENDAEEIHFFKNVKPRFTGEIEYYVQRYHALLSMRDLSSAEIKNFWNNELKRIAKFYDVEQEFFHYYNSGRVMYDELFFLRRNSDGSNLKHTRAYENDTETSTSHDWLLAKNIGYDKYEEFIREQLKKMKYSQ